MADLRADPTKASDEAGELALSLVRGDLLFRLQRAIGLIPAEGLGVGRRALALALFTWLPIAAWAALAGHAVGDAVGEPLLAHFGVHVRCLVAIPLFVLAEASGHAVTARLVPHFLRSGLVPEAERGRFLETLRSAARLRDATRPWVVIAGVVAAWSVIAPATIDAHELVWAGEGDAPARLGFGGFWYLYVARPIFFGLALAWLWRLVLACVLMARLSRLDLALVPTHPDGAGGLGFLSGLPRIFAPVVLGLSAVLASRWAHDVVYHGVHVTSLRLPMIGFLVLVLVLFLTPLLAFAPRLVATKRAALLQYGALVGEHGRMVRRRWILREPLADDALLGAPEIGPVADTVSLYEAVRKMRPAPLDRQSVVGLVLPAAIPMIAVLAIEVPIKDMLLKILGALA